MSYKLTATGFDENKPIADNKTDVGAAKNRRVKLKQLTRLYKEGLVLV